jgi:putative endonuclease
MGNFYYVYILFSFKDHQLYIGYSADLRTRIQTHKDGKVRSTRDRRPIELIHYEAFGSKRDARAREIFLKSGFGRSQLKKSLQNLLKELGYVFL